MSVANCTQVSPTTQWTRARTGTDPQAIEVVIAGVQRLVLSAARSVGSISSRTDPEDAAQSALLYIYHCVANGSFADSTEAQFREFCYRQGLNKARWEIRKQRAAKRDVRRSEVMAAEPAKPIAPDVLIVREEVQQVFELYADRPEYLAILQGLLEGRTGAEIGQQLGLNTNQVFSKLKRIRIACAKIK